VRTLATPGAAAIGTCVCPHCNKPENICVCDRSTKQPCKVRVVVMQHPQEQDLELGSARVLLANLDRAELRVGLSWPSLSAFLGEEAEPARWAVLFPGKADEAPPPGSESFAQLLDRRGRASDPASVTGLIVLDGTWTQAKTLWWRNAWLLKLSRLVLWPREPSIYGSLRKEPRTTYVSTLEAAADGLVALGEPTETRAHLRRVFRTMVQRARDARKTGSAPA
jgi:DTW domain-containing protein